MRLTLSLAALAASLAVASPAFAQSAPITASDEAQARGVVLLPLTLESTQDLDFGTIIANQNTPGTVVIDPETGNRSVTGAVLEVAGPTYQRALFQGVGPANTDVDLDFTSAVVLSRNGGGDTILGTLALDQSDSRTRTLGATGAFSVAVGGSFAIKAAQMAGLYEATFDLTAQYE